MAKAISLLAVLVISGVFFVTSALAADVAKIGVIDSQKILMTSDAGKAVQAIINKEGRQMEADLKKTGAEIEKAKEQLEKEAMVMSREVRDQKERELRIKINDIKTQQKKFRQKLQTIERKKLDELRKDILAVAQEIGKKEGYLLIIENVGVLYSPASIDITDQLIKKYNAMYSKKKAGQ
jgi:outer membrane protein